MIYGTQTLKLGVSPPWLRVFCHLCPQAVEHHNPDRLEQVCPWPSLWGLEVTLVGPGLGLGSRQALKRIQGMEGWVKALGWRAGHPNTLQAAGTQSQSQTPWMCVCLWLTDASKRLTLEFPLKLLGHSTESRVEKQMRGYGF